MAAPAPVGQFYDASGKPLSGEALQEAWRSGTAHVAAGQAVHMLDENQDLRLVPAEHVVAARARGFAPASEEAVAAHAEHEQYGKGLGSQAEAAVAGAARGLTLGGSDYLATKIGGEGTRHALDALRRQNPITSGVSEVAGAAAPVLLSGGAAAPEEAGALAAGEGAQALGEGAEIASSATRGLGGVAGDAVRTAGALPRATAAAGSLVERGAAAGLKALGYEGKTLAGRVAAGAIKTGASGATEGAIYGGAQAADDSILKGDDVTAEKIVAGMGDGALFGGALGAGLGALGPLASGVASKVLPDAESLQEFGRDRALKAVGRDTESYGKNLPADQRSALRKSIAEDLDYTLKTGDLAGKPVVAAGDNAEAILSKLNQAKQETGAALGGVKDEVNDLMIQNPHLAPDMGELFAKIKAEVLDPLVQSKSQGSRSQARAVERELSVLRQEHEARLAGAGNDNAGEAVAAAPTFRELDEYRQMLAANQTPKGASRAVAAATNKNLEPLEKTARVIGDYLKDKAEQALTSTGQDAAGYRELSRQYFSFNALQRSADKAVAAAARNRSVSASDYGLGLAGFLGSIVTGNVGGLAAMAHGAAYTVANKLLRERGNSLLSVMAKRAAEMDGHVDLVARALAGHADAVKAATVSTAMTGRRLKEEYDEAAERVRDLSRPGAAIDHVARLIPEVSAQYPQLGAAVSNKLTGIYGHLAASLPPSNVTSGDVLTPLAVKDRTDPVSMRKFLSRVRGATRPAEVIRDLARGRIDRDALDSVKAIYPETFAELQTKALTYVAQREEELPYRERSFISLAFGVEGDPSFAQPRLASLQQAISSQSSPSNGAGGSRPKTARPRPSRLGKGYATPADSALGESA